MVYSNHNKKSYKPKRSSTLSALFCLILTGCNNYQVSLNERTIYTPPPLLKDIPIADDALRNCIKQSIVDQQVTQFDELKELNCSNAGIQSLAGLEHFSALSQLDLAHNTLTDVTPLSLLSQITYLKLNNNQITNVTSLKALNALRHIDLSENSQLICSSGQVLASITDKHTAREDGRPPIKNIVLPSACATLNLSE